MHEESQGREVDPMFGSGGGGHALNDLNAKVFEILVSEARQKTLYVGGLISEVSTDPYWSDILLALDGWAATSGRYRDLDALRGKQAQGDPPWAGWERAERRAVEENGGWVNLTDETLVAARQRMLLSIMRWWHTIYRCWQHGLVGEDGKVFSSELKPRNHHLDSSIAALGRVSYMRSQVRMALIVMAAR